MAGECKNEEYSVGERCCDKCPKGHYVHTDCDGSKRTECIPCGHHYYTNGPNYLRTCFHCRTCHSTNHMMTAMECEAVRDRQCKCRPGFYCTSLSDNNCENCVPVTTCPVGSGVKTEATPLRNTECTRCLPGTYSSVEDATSPCHNHTRCEDLGRKQTTAGNETSNAVCGSLKNGCSWMLPAGLWAGLVVTLIFIVLIYIIRWRAKRHSYRTAVSSHPRESVEAADPAILAEPPKPSSEWSEHCQEIGDGEKGKEPLFLKQGDSPRVINTVTCHQHCAIESDGPPRKPITDMNGHYTTPSLIIQSEPQEDEWSGT